jgi:hypothetical protein
LKKKQGVRKKCGNGGRQVGYGNDYQGELRGGRCREGGIWGKAFGDAGGFFLGEGFEEEARTEAQRREGHFLYSVFAVPP